VGGQKATSIVLRPAGSISADMLFLEYRARSGAAAATAVPAFNHARSCCSTGQHMLMCDSETFCCHC
jgi:hypothetical protein